MRRFLLWVSALVIVFFAFRFLGWWGVPLLIWVGYFSVTKLWYSGYTGLGVDRLLGKAQSSTRPGRRNSA